MTRCRNHEGIGSCDGHADGAGRTRLADMVRDLAISRGAATGILSSVSRPALRIGADQHDTKRRLGLPGLGLEDAAA